MVNYQLLVVKDMIHQEEEQEVELLFTVHLTMNMEVNY